jgi:hypothetical protein
MLKVLTQSNPVVNRANAQKSTGPRTNQGKTASKMNAVKHGILSREVLVAGEDQQEFTVLQEWFDEDLRPVGAMEILLVDQIVATHWRLRRLLAAESGEIQREANLRQASAKSSALPPDLEDTAAGCKLLQTYLSDTLLAVERDGELTRESVSHFSCRLGALSSTVKRELMELHFDQSLLKAHSDAEEAPQREKRKQSAVKFLQRNLGRLAEREAECQKKEAEVKAPPIVGVLPGAEAMDKFIRYESMLNRQLFRAMKELRTLQEKREEKQKVEIGKAERKPEAEGQSENLPNEAIARNAVQSSEFNVQSFPELPNEPILASHPSQISHLRSPMDEKMPNEAIARRAVQSSEFKV